jgi:hypothetical protein
LGTVIGYHEEEELKFVEGWRVGELAVPMAKYRTEHEGVGVLPRDWFKKYENW